MLKREKERWSDERQRDTERRHKKGEAKHLLYLLLGSSGTGKRSFSILGILILNTDQAGEVICYEVSSQAFSGQKKKKKSNVPKENELVMAF